MMTYELYGMTMLPCDNDKTLHLSSCYACLYASSANANVLPLGFAFAIEQTENVDSRLTVLNCYDCPALGLLCRDHKTTHRAIIEGLPSSGEPVRYRLTALSWSTSLLVSTANTDGSEELGLIIT